MHIQHDEFGNFRKLQAIRVDFAEETTVFARANNSGKTSARVALRHFLVDRTDFSISDFTLSPWAKLDAMAIAWEACVAAELALESGKLSGEHAWNVLASLKNNTPAAKLREAMAAGLAHLPLKLRIEPAAKVYLSPVIDYFDGLVVS